MTETEYLFHRSAELVRKWGKSRLSNGRTLEKTLVIGGISFWDVISPSLAVSSVASALSQKKCSDLMLPGALIKRRVKRVLFDAVLPVLGNSHGCTQCVSKDSFLFLGFSHYMYREVLSPVAQSISERKGCSAVVLTDTLDTRFVRARVDAPIFNSIWQHWTSQVAIEAASLRKDLNTAVVDIQDGGGLSSIMIGGERPLFPIMQNTMNWVFSALLPRLISHLAVAKHVLAEHKPKLIISPDANDPRTRIYALLGQIMNIPSLDVQLGFASENNVEWQFFNSDYLAVNGESNREVMVFHGIPPEKIVITGSPRYDTSLRFGQGHCVKKSVPFREQGKRNILLFASQPYVCGSFTSPEIRLKMIRALFNSVGGIKGLNLIVKPHPLEDVGELKSLLDGENPNIVFAHKNSDIRELISACDMFTTFFSTTIFDSLAMNKPTILISFPNSNNCKVFEESGAALVARSEADIQGTIKLVMHGLPSEREVQIQSARDIFLKKWLYKIDGCSTERVVSLALKISESK